MDLDVDPYVVESEVEKDDLFGDASGATTATGGLVERDAVEDAETEIAAAKFLPGPHEPTQSQAEDHCASGHIPFRSWCSECVRARGTGEQHRRRKDRRDICVFSFDYLHLDEAGKPLNRGSIATGAKAAITILVAKDSLGKAVFAHVVLQKGVDSAHYSVDALVRDVAWLGYTRLSLRSDNEPAILSLLKHALTEARFQVEQLEQLVQEHPNAYDHAANGEIEATVKQVTGIIRTNKLDLERRVQREVPVDHPVMTWLVEYAAWMINVRVIGADGAVAFERVRGRPFHKRLLPFGERVHVHLPRDSPAQVDGGALDSRAVDGIMLGYGDVSHSYLVWMPHVQQVCLMRSITRRPLSQRWSAEDLQAVNATKKDCHAGRGARAVPFVRRQRAVEVAVERPLGQRYARRLELRQSDFDPAAGGHGWTEHCPKCDKARLYGWRSAIQMHHSDACRARIEMALGQTQRGQERLEHTKLRFDRRRAAPAAAETDAPLEPARVEGEISGAGGPPKLVESDNEMGGIDPDDADDSEDEEMQQQYSPASPGSPMSAANDLAALASATRRRTCKMPDERRTILPSAWQPWSHDAETEDDLQPILNLIEQDELLYKELTEHAAETAQIVASLGGRRTGYQRERRQAAQRMISEIYSAPRVTKVMKLMPSLDLVPGFALDLSGNDENGHAWDFTRADMREKAKALVLKERPYVLIGSPPCTAFSSWQHLNAARLGWTAQEIRRRRAEGELHVRFCCELYKLQAAAGRYYLHEHPANATSWQLEEVRAMLQLDGTRQVVGDQCQYGQETSSGHPVKKPTRWLTNSPELAKTLGDRCLGAAGRCTRPGGGSHAVASGKIAREAAVYPFKLCRAILRGCVRQLQADRRLQSGQHGVQCLWEESAETMLAELDSETVMEVMSVAGSAAAIQNKLFKDSVTGQPLPGELVCAARKLELDYFEKKLVWERVPRGEAFARTGKAPISVRWIDTNKGDDDTPNIRCRLVAREIRKAGEDPIFALTPPLESLRTIISLAATDFEGAPRKNRDPASPDRIQVSFIDISRAYFCAETDPNDPTYVELPPEDPDHGTMVGRLLKHMYGTRKAADGWHCEYAGRLVNDLGFTVGDASACVFFHAERELRCSVHGDDITTVGSKANLDWFRTELEKYYELKEAQRLGPGPHDHKEAVVLNRVVRWTAEGLEYEADPRQGEKLLRDLQLDGEGVKDAATPGVKATREQLDEDLPLERSKHTPYRAVVARANYLASDRPDIQFSAKEICRWMSSPTELALRALKRLGRYVVGHRRLVYKYPWQTVNRIDAYSDTDWSGCPKTRKSTSGGCVMLGKHLIKSWSSTQASVSLSSGEAEFYGVVKAGGTCLGYQSLVKDLGYRLPVRVWTDSIATMGICGRQGLGKLRHIDTQCLWIQQRVRDGAIELVKVRGDDNPADVFTKHLQSRDRIRGLLALFGCVYTDGRPAIAPQLRTGTGTTKGELLALAEQTVTWEGVTFPAVEHEDEWLPEAFLSEPGTLPHLHADERTRYPRAVVRHHPGDEDPWCDDSLEMRGVVIGQCQPRRAPHRSSSLGAPDSSTTRGPQGDPSALKA